VGGVLLTATLCVTCGFVCNGFGGMGACELGNCPLVDEVDPSRFGL